VERDDIGDRFCGGILLFDRSIKKGKGQRRNSCTESHVGDGEFGEIKSGRRKALSCSNLGLGSGAGNTPSLGSIGIMNLAGNVELNPGAQ